MARCRELFPRCASCGNAGSVQAVALRLKINRVRIDPNAPPQTIYRSRLAVDNVQVVRGLGEGLVAVLGDDAVVLQAHAAHTGQVHAGLHGDN